VDVLVVNAGSSSLKLAVVGNDGDAATRELEAPGAAVDTDALAAVIDTLPPFAATGHRIVHGGARFSGPVRVDDGVLAALRDLIPLAPLHQPKALAALEAVSRLRPDVPAVACFDTAFHTTLPAAAATYALPREWTERFALRRYGFHGLSHAHAARRAPELLGRERLRLVNCHLGAGASLAAIRDGRSVDTTMGFTPVEGLVMATRPGSVDPGMLAWLMTEGGIAPDELADALEHRSGVAALAGSGDMREILARARARDEEARLALAVYVHRLRREIAAMAAAMDGLDALAFTGGVGEHAAEVRATTVAGLGFLGVAVDVAANADAKPDADISAAGAPARTLVLTAREDLEIARQVRALVDGQVSGAR
jgi:acetate kinase